MGPTPVLLLDLADFSTYRSTQNLPLLETLDELLTQSARFAIPHGSIWKTKWIRHGTGDGYYIFFKDESAHLALYYACQLVEKLVAHNRAHPRDLPMRMRLVLGIGAIEKVIDQWHGEVLTQTQRLVDHPAMRTYLKTLSQAGISPWVLATTTEFHFAWQKDPLREKSELVLNKTPWTYFEVQDKHHKPHSGYVWNQGHWNPAWCLDPSEPTHANVSGTTKPVQSSKSKKETQVEKPPQSGPILTWLHLSDFHFRAESDWKQDAVLNSLLRDVIRKLPEQGLSPDMVFLTGDIAQSGKASEYETARDFFNELADTLEHDPAHCWFMVPGNHDADRSRVKNFRKKDRDQFINRKETDKLLSETETWETLSVRQKDFLDFTHEFLGPSRAWRADKPWAVEFFQKENLRIALLSLNSALCCQDDEDKNKLVMGEYQARDAINESGEADLRIALFHHPLEWLREFDQKQVKGVLAGSGACHFLLRGHLHDTEMEVKIRPSSGTVELAAGACWQDAKHAHSVLAVQLDVAQRTITLHVWSYDDRHGGSWKRDNPYPGMEHGRWTTSFPERWNFSSHTPKPSTPAAPLIPSKYRDELKRICGTLENLVRTDQPLACRLEDVYLPLKTNWLEPEKKQLLTEGKQDQEKAMAEAKQQERPLTELVSHEKHRHFLITGGPGSGKTTFMRYMTLEMIGTADQRLPLHLPLKAFGLWLEDHPGEEPEQLINWAQDRLGRFGLSDLGPHRGKLLWLLDGLDEIFADGPRLRAAQIIAAFIRDPETSGDRLLITTRPHALNGDVENALAMHDLKAPILSLNHEDQRRFLTGWFQALYRDRGNAVSYRDDLWQKLERNPNLSDMRNTPLLLSMIATVYHLGKELPERRADLYEQAVWVLLQRRYGANGRNNGSDRLVREMRQSLMATARWMMEHGAVRDIGQLEFIAILDRVMPKTEKQGNRQVWLEGLAVDLGSHSGLLSKRGTSYAFIHLGFQEFLTARALASDPEVVKLTEARFKDSAWKEVILLIVSHLYEMNSKASGEALLELLMEQNIALAVEAAAGAPPGELGDLEKDLQDRSVQLLEDWKTYPSEQNRFQLGLALGYLGDPRLGLEREENWVALGEKEKAFSFSRYLVTNQDYKGFIQDKGYQNPQWWDDGGWLWLEKEIPEPEERFPALWWNKDWNAPNQPVVGVNWYEARAFCRWLMQRLEKAGIANGKVIDLPNDEQWDLASGAEKQKYPWGDDDADASRANFDDRLSRTTPVGLYPNGKAAGLLDLAGNVWEWNLDTNSDNNPFVRGGSWRDPSQYLVASFRSGSGAWGRGLNVGFRCCLAPAEPI